MVSSETYLCKHGHRKRRSCTPLPSTKPSTSTDTGTRKALAANSLMRMNNATLLGLDSAFLDRPKDKGSLYNGAPGSNYRGDYPTKYVWIKWMRSKHRSEDLSHFRSVGMAVAVTARVLYDFLHEVDTRGWHVMVNMPRMYETSGADGRVVLVEPYIKSFERMNSNTGWTAQSRRTYMKVMQALSHYSYVWSGGEFVVCGLQGGADFERKQVVLGHPEVLSRKQNYGLTDLGEEGIRRFFHKHVCNEMCEGMAVPQDRKLFFRPV